jgi:hypothetical protein
MSRASQFNGAGSKHKAENKNKEDHESTRLRQGLRAYGGAKGDQGFRLR